MALWEGVSIRCRICCAFDVFFVSTISALVIVVFAYKTCRIYIYRHLYADFNILWTLSVIKPSLWMPSLSSAAKSIMDAAAMESGWRQRRFWRPLSAARPLKVAWNEWLWQAVGNFIEVEQPIWMRFMMLLKSTICAARTNRRTLNPSWFVVSRARVDRQSICGSFGHWSGCRGATSVHA